ncbi:hypothetical protein DM01DRAFT_41177 [Hesseltinella vesiculosa]|uniref:Uncharacterized protein n=1 Tax=Hesseltinella vesiculosa TaxID=101127 RepID=A0A1X2GWY3_9FUNG|nr:hypothetical protein DM01DRAFT_41177 [Hesseltinella vesiculosa]
MKVKGKGKRRKTMGQKRGSANKKKGGDKTRRTGSCKAKRTGQRLFIAMGATPIRFYKKRKAIDRWYGTAGICGVILYQFMISQRWLSSRRSFLVTLLCYQR